MEHYARQIAKAPDPRGRAQVAFTRLRAVAPPHDQVWDHVRTVLEQVTGERSRT
jgi:hypothetical protein